MISTRIINAINSESVAIYQQAIRDCGAVFGFDVDQAIQELTQKMGEFKVSTKVSKTPKENKEKPEKIKSVPLPWMGVVNPEKCENIAFCGGLFNQCSGARCENGFCSKCKQASSEYFTVAERLAQGAEWKDAKGRKPFALNRVLKKLKLTQEMMMEEAEKQGITLDASLFEVKVAEKKPKTVRGRPKAPKVEVEDAGNGMTDLFDSLVNEAEEGTVVSNLTASTGSKKSKLSPEEKAEREAKKAAEKAEKEAKRAAEKAEREAKAKAEKDAYDALSAEEKVAYNKAKKDAAEAKAKAEYEALSPEKKAEVDAKKVAAELEKEAKKVAAEAEKEAKKAAAKAEKEAEKLAKAEQAKAEKLAKAAAEALKKAEEKLAKEEARKAKRAADRANKKAEKGGKKEAKPEVKAEPEAEVEVRKVAKITIDGVMYYYDKATKEVIDNLEDQNVIGVLINCEMNEKGKVTKAEIKKYANDAEKVETEDEYESENDADEDDDE